MKSILIVEDDITYGMILKTWLGKKGFQVSSASSIARAPKHIEAETAELFLQQFQSFRGRRIARLERVYQCDVPRLRMGGAGTPHEAEGKRQYIYGNYRCLLHIRKVLSTCTSKDTNVF